MHVPCIFSCCCRLLCFDFVADCCCCFGRRGSPASVCVGRVPEGVAFIERGGEEKKDVKCSRERCDFHALTYTHTPHTHTHTHTHTLSLSLFVCLFAAAAARADGRCVGAAVERPPCHCGAQHLCCALLPHAAVAPGGSQRRARCAPGSRRGACARVPGRRVGWQSGEHQPTLVCPRPGKVRALCSLLLLAAPCCW